MQGNQQVADGNSLSFFRGEADGLKLNPYTVMVICLMYIGAVVLLHIFSKVKGANKPMATPEPEPEVDPEPEGEL